ncbi:DUF4235 domain-containing protein [Oerskovia sp. M15]
MADNEQTLTEKVATVALTLAAGWVAQKVVTVVWAKPPGTTRPRTSTTPRSASSAP